MKKFILSIITIFAGGIFITVSPSYAQTLSFEPTQKGVSIGESFTVKININTSSQQTSGADAQITYDSNVLQIGTISSGGFYSNFGSNPVSGEPNKYTISGFETDSTSTKTGTGTFAQIIFTGKASGTSTVSFDCTAGNTTDSNIIKVGGDDIITCASLSTASYTVGGGGGSNNTPAPTNLPVTGSTEVTMVAVGVGILLTVLGLVFRL